MHACMFELYIKGNNPFVTFFTSCGGGGRARGRAGRVAGARRA